MPTEGTLAAADIRDWLLEQGRAFISSEELCERLGVLREKLPDALRAVRNRGEMARVCRGGWAAVEPYHQARRTISPYTFLDDMMEHLGHDYQVGFAAAATKYGATYRIPSTVTVLTEARMGQVTVTSRHKDTDAAASAFLSGLRWVYRSNPSERGVHCDERQFPERIEKVRYSTPEVTALDCVLHPNMAVGWANIMNILPRMIYFDYLDAERLAETALLYPADIRQRLGTALDISAEYMETVFDTAPLRGTLPNTLSATRIMPECEYFFAPVSNPEEEIYFNEKWGTIVNTFLEPEA